MPRILVSHTEQGRMVHSFKKSNRLWQQYQRGANIGITNLLVFLNIFNTLFNILSSLFYLHYSDSLRVFPIRLSWWSFTRVWVTASLLKSLGFFSVFWPISVIIIIIIIIIIILIIWEIFTSALADSFSQESGWQQVSSSLWDSSQFSGRSQLLLLLF